MYNLKSIIVLATLLGTTFVNAYTFKIGLEDKSIIFDGSTALDENEASFDISSTDKKELTWKIYKESGKEHVLWEIKFDAIVFKSGTGTAEFKLQESSPWFQVIDDKGNTSLKSSKADCKVDECVGETKPDFDTAKKTVE